MEILRTPDERFEDLPDFSWAARYADVGGVRMAYLDEGPSDVAVTSHKTIARPKTLRKYLHYAGVR